MPCSARSTTVRPRPMVAAGPPPTTEERGATLLRVGATVGAGAAAAIVCVVPATLRVATDGEPGVAQALIALAACALVPMIASIVALRGAREGLRAFAGPGAGLRAFGVGLWLATLLVGLSIFGSLLRATTHHHALAGVTFAFGSLFFAIGDALVCARVLVIARGMPDRGRRVLLLALAASVGVLLFAVGVRFVRAASHDAASFAAAGTVVDVLAFVLAAIFAVASEAGLAAAAGSGRSAGGGHRGGHRHRRAARRGRARCRDRPRARLLARRRHTRGALTPLPGGRCARAMPAPAGASDQEKFAMRRSGLAVAMFVGALVLAPAALADPQPAALPPLPAPPPSAAAAPPSSATPSPATAPAAVPAANGIAVVAMAGATDATWPLAQAVYCDSAPSPGCRRRGARSRPVRRARPSRIARRPARPGRHRRGRPRRRRGLARHPRRHGAEAERPRPRGGPRRRGQTGRAGLRRRDASIRCRLVRSRHRCGRRDYVVCHHGLTDTLLRRLRGCPRHGQCGASDGRAPLATHEEPAVTNAPPKPKAFYESGWFWGALGAAAFAGGAVYFATRDNGASDDPS